MALLAAFFWGSGDFVSRKSSTKVGYYATATYGNVYSSLVLLAVIETLGISLAIPVASLALLFVGSVAFLSSYVLAYRVFSLAPLSIVAPITYTAPAIAVVFSILLLGITLSPVEGLSVVIVMAGTALLATRFSELRRFRGRSGSVRTQEVLPAIGGAFSFAFVFLTLSFVVPGTGYLVPVLFLRSFATFNGFVLAPAFRQDVRPTREKLSLVVLVMGVLDTLGFVFLSLGLVTAGGSLPLVIMVSGLGGAFLVGYGILLLKEKPEINQLIGMGLSTVGVAALLYLTA